MYDICIVLLIDAYIAQCFVPLFPYVVRLLVSTSDRSLYSFTPVVSFTWFRSRISNINDHLGNPPRDNYSLSM